MQADARRPVLVLGGGIGGLSLALSLHQAGVPCRVFESARAFRPLGVGINLLPHCTREFAELGLLGALERVAVQTREMRFYNRFGQFIHAEPRGRFDGYAWPQLSIHRADLHAALLEAVRARLGGQACLTGHECVEVIDDGAAVTARFANGESAEGRCAIGCDGIHSAVRRQLFPGEGPPVWQGIQMWRGTTRMKPFLGGASMVLAGWLAVGKLVVYPVRPVEPGGLQLVNWVAEIQSERRVAQDWNARGRLEDFLPAFRDWRFDWLDCAAMIDGAGEVLEYPMVDREPLSCWARGRIALLGDAAHPMYPRGSNGAGQAVLDARALAGCLRRQPDAERALAEYEGLRLAAVNAVVLANRSEGPDAILREVWRRSGDRPFARVEDLISADEMARMSGGYKRVAGFDRDSLAQRASYL